MKRLSVALIGMLALAGCGGGWAAAYNTTVTAYETLDKLATTFYLDEYERCSKSMDDFETCMYTADNVRDGLQALYAALNNAKDGRAKDAICAAVDGLFRVLQTRFREPMPQKIFKYLEVIQGSVCE